MSVSAIASAFNDQPQRDILNLVFDELAAIRKMLGAATGGSGAGILVGSGTWDAASIANGAEEVKSLTVSGAALGDFVLASHGVDVADLSLVAAVTATDTVKAQLLNNTGGAIDLASATLRVMVIPKAAANQMLAAMVLTKT